MSIAPPFQTPSEQSAPAIAEKLNITCDRDLFYKELVAVNNATILGKHAALPFFSSVLIQAKPDAVVLTGTLLERTIRSFTENINIISTGTALVPAKRLLDYIHLLDTGKISITQEANGWVCVRQGKKFARLISTTGDVFPSIADIPSNVNTITIPSFVFRTLISLVRPFVSKENSRFFGNCAYFTIDKDRYTMTATDSHMLAIASFPIEEKFTPPADIPLPFKLTIPDAVLDNVRALLENNKNAIEDTVNLTADEKSAFIIIKNRTLSFVKPSDKFLDHTKITEGARGDAANEKTIMVNPADLMVAIQRVMQTCDERSSAVVFTFDNDCIHLSAKSIEGESEETISVPYNYGPFTIGISGTFLTTVLRNLIEQDQISISMTSPTKVVTIAKKDHEVFDYCCLVMPMTMPTTT